MEGETFAKENGLAFFECSAKSADFVDAAFLTTAEIVHDQTQGGRLNSTEVWYGTLQVPFTAAHTTNHCYTLCIAFFTNVYVITTLLYSFYDFIEIESHFDREPNFT